MRSGLQAMTGLINKRLSKTEVKLVPTYASIRGIPIIIGVDEKPEKPKPYYGGAGLLGTGFFANVTEAIEQTRADVETLRNEVFAAAVSGYSQGKPDVYNYYNSVIVPFLKDWNEFDIAHHGGWRRFGDWFILSGLSTWHSLNQYRERLLDIRNSAEKLMTFNAPKPMGPNIDVIQQGLNKAADAGATLWDTLKWVIIIATAAIGIGIVIYLGGMK